MSIQIANKYMEKCSTFNHLGNANQTHNEISLHIKYYDCKQKVTSTGKDGEKLEPSYIDGGNVKWFSQFVKQFCGSWKS